MLASARSVSSATKSPLKLVFASSVHALETPAAPRIKQHPTLSRMRSYDDDATHAGLSLGITMRDILPHRVVYENAIAKLRAATGVGLGIDFNSRDIGPLAPPPTPRLASSATLPNAGLRLSRPETVEGQALNSLTTSKLFMRRRQANKPLPPIATTQTAKSLATQCPDAVQPKAMFPLSAAVPPSHTLSAIHALASSSPTAAGTFAPRAQTDNEPVGLGISSPASDNDEEDSEVIFEDGEWEYIKPAGLKSCKGRVCTPSATKHSWLFSKS